MLYRKTMKAVSAAILAITALLGVGAQAAINLEAATAAGVGTITFSKETLDSVSGATRHHPLRLDETPPSVGDLPTSCAFASTATTAKLQVSGMLGTRVAAGNTRYVRLDMVNMRFRRALRLSAGGFPDSCIEGVSGGVALESGGGLGDSHVILSVAVEDGGTDLASSAQIGFRLFDALEIATGATSGQFRLRSFADLGTATLGAAPLRDKTVTGVIVASSVTASIADGAVPATAEVSATPRFTDFVGGGRKPLGRVTTTLNTTHLKATVGGGYVASLSDVLLRGTITFTSPTGLEFGTFSLHAAADCSGAGAPVSVVATPTAEGAVTPPNVGQGAAAVAVGTRTLCVAQRKYDHDDDKATPTQGREIPVTSINAQIAFVKNAAAHYAPANVADSPIGSIDRNGSTVELPYLSTHEGYNNRIILVNRGKVSADYEFTFTLEDGVTATAGHMASGTVAANSTMVLRAADVVTLTGGSRAAATLTVVAPTSALDVATTIVNKSDGSTDTVRYDIN